MKKWMIAGVLIMAGGGATAAMSTGSSQNDDVRTADLSNQAEEVHQEVLRAEIERSDDEGVSQTESVSGSEEMISPMRAVEIAQGIVDGQLKDIELDTDNGRLIYEVELKIYGDDTEIEVDAITGEVVEADDNLWRSETIGNFKNNQDGAQVTPAEAKRLALEAVGGGYVDDIDLEFEKGQLVYEVEVEYQDDDADVYVDARSGEVIYIDR